MTTQSDEVRVITLGANCPALPIVETGGHALALIWPGTGATHRSMHHIALEPGGQTVMLRHPGEAVYYVKSGGGTVEDKAVGSVDTLVTGAMIHVEPHTPYRFVGGERGMTLLGGPAPHDPTMYAHL